VKRAAWFTTLVMATLAVLALLWQFREAVALFLFSLGVGAAARPLVDRLVARKIPRGLGLVLVYLGIVGGLALLLVALGGEIVGEISRLTDRFVSVYDHLWSNWPHGTPLEQAIVKDLPPPAQLYQAFTGTQGGAFFQTLLGFTISSVTLLSQFFAVLVLSIYWTIDQVHFERLWLSLLPSEQRARARETWREIESGVGAYLRSELTQSLLAGLLLGIAFWMIGLDYPVLLAIFGAIAWLVPWLGALLALVPVILSGLQGGWDLAALAGACTIGILVFLEVIVEPRLYSRRPVSSLLTVVIMIALADVMGLVGLLLAPPLAAAIQILYAGLVRAQVVERTAEPSHRLDELKARLDEVRRQAAGREEPLPPQTVSLMERMEALLQKASGELSDS
jgi:predicted PurR-regulated permease PerM